MVIHWNVIGWSLVIVVARMADVSLGTLRTVAVINGRRNLAWLLGFVEVLIWILVVSEVIKTVGQSPLYPVAYAFGFAMGTFVGITIEGRIGFGDQVIRVFSRQGAHMAATMRNEGHRVTEFEGKGRDGPVAMLFIEIKRRGVPAMLCRAREIDPDCYYIVDDIRMASARRQAGAK